MIDYFLLILKRELVDNEGETLRTITITNIE